MPEEIKNEDVIRLEERTKGLERSDRRHYAFELVLFLAFIIMCLLVVNGCEINTPSPKTESTTQGAKERKKEWSYTTEVEIDTLTMEVSESGKSVLVFVSGEAKGEIKGGETVKLYRLGRTLSAEFESEKITVYDNSYDTSGGVTKKRIGTFNYE